MRIVLLAVATAFSFLSYAQTNVYSPENVRKFADHLYSTRKYTAAAAEYERLWLLEPGNDTAAGMTLKCLRLNGDYKGAVTKAREHSLFPSAYPAFTVQEFITSAARGEYHGLVSMAVLNPNISSADSFRHMLNIRVICMDFALAKEMISLPGGSTYAYSQQSDLLERGMNIRYKKPWLAAGLSAVVPGSGKVYTGDWKDGVFSFLTIGIFTYEAYVGFNHDGIKSPLGWIAGGIALGFYGAGIYGSAKSAKKFNQLQNEHFREYAKDILYPVY